MICRPVLKHSDVRTLNFKFANCYKFAHRINKPNQCLFAMKGRCFFNGYTIMTLVFTTLMTKDRIKITWCKNKNTLSTAALIRSRKFLLQGKIFNCFLLSWWILLVMDFRLVWKLAWSAIILVAAEIWILAPKITSWFQNLGAKMDAWIQNYGAKNNSWSRSDDEDLNQLVCFTFFSAGGGDQCGLKTLPGFMMPLGSKACLMAHIMSTDTGPYISSRRIILPENYK